MTKEQTTYAGVKTSIFDAAGNRTRLSWPDGFYVDYVYDAASELTQIRENGATSGAGVLATFTYDDAGRRVRLARGNGTATTYSYDGVSRLGSLAHDLGGTANDVSWTFGFNPASQIVTSTRSNDLYAWTGAVNVDRAYAVNGRNQYTQSGNVTLAYDARGNLSNSETMAFSYNQRGLLSMATGATLTYDPAGNLDLIADGSANTTFDYVGGNIVAEGQKGGATTKRRYIYGPGVDEPLVWYELGDATPRRWLYADERGSIVAVANDAGNVIGINRYDEYGIPASTNIGRFQYTGQAWLPGQGLYYYKARMYSQTLGSFLQPDPTGYEDGMNFYAYAGNDPVNMADPSGLGTECAGTSCFETSDAPLPLPTLDLPIGNVPGLDDIVVTGQSASDFALLTVSKETLAQFYVSGLGGTVHLSGAQFRNALANFKPTTSKIRMSTGGYALGGNGYGTPLGYALGGFTVLYSSDGKPIGLRDSYDFNSMNYGLRDGASSWFYLRENFTRIVGAVGSMIGAAPFEIRYP